MASPPSARRRSNIPAQGENVPAASGALPPAATVHHGDPVGGNNSNQIASPFPDAFSEQLVQRVTTEVTKQLQATPSFPAVGITANSLPPVRTNDVQHSAREVPIVGASAVGDPVHWVVHSFHSIITGEGPSLPGSAHPKEVFSSINLPVDACVQEKLKTKIWQQEFIDFGSLVSNHTMEGKYQLTIHNPVEGSSPSLALEPVNKTKKIVAIDSWIQAFHVFVGIYTSRYPSEAPGLMKYGATIQDLAARGHNWRFYDENFRFLWQTPTTSLPWNTIHWELWLRSQSSARKQLPPTNAGKPGSNVRVPRGFCCIYHRGGDCMGCSFKHGCFKCEGSHRALNCNFRGKTTGTQF